MDVGYALGGLAQYLGVMALGFVAGKLSRVRTPPKLFTSVVALIIFLVSASAAPTIVEEAGYILGVSFAYALALVFASAIPLSLAGGRGGNTTAPAARISATAVLSLLAGAAAGNILRAPYSDLIQPVLLALLFLAGLDLGAVGPLRLDARHLAPPVVSLAASLAVSLLFFYAFGISPAVGLGMGWYSFTGPFLLKASGDATLASIGFMANFLREQLTYALTPLLARRLPPYAALSIGGATTMDNTLPLYRALYGPEILIPAVINGVLLTILVPVIVPLTYFAFP
ncbi:MAG: lysine exporter LysO family protein [Thermoproteus sp.]|nr:lysine exporter LysO family protein [Thermoproteus sp.]